MRHARAVGQALKLATEPIRQPYICRTCARQFSSTSSNAAEAPFWQRMQENIFGTEKDSKAKATREERQKKRGDAAAESGNKELTTMRDHRGNVYEVARFVDSRTDPGYVPATTAVGLERVGSKKWARERADGGEKYTGFNAQKQAQLSNERWQKLLHHIAVEVFTLQKAGRDVLEVCNGRSDDAHNWEMTAGAAITPVDGLHTLTLLDSASQQEILDAIKTDGAAIPELHENELAKATSSDIELTYANGKVGWMAVSLEDPKLKLAILKRTIQLSGRRIPDPVISKSTTLADLYHAFKTKEKPAKFADTQEYRRLPVESSNVALHRTRRTPVHKEKEIGRWKIIEDELSLRGLPVFGSNYSSKDKEHEKWKGFESKRGAASKASAAKGM